MLTERSDLAGVQRRPPRLGSLFAVFARLTRHEAMPGTEQVTSRLRRLLRPAVVIPVTPITLAGMVAASWLIPGGPACAMTPGVAGTGFR